MLFTSKAVPFQTPTIALQTIKGKVCMENLYGEQLENNWLNFILAAAISICSKHSFSHGILIKKKKKKKKKMEII